MSRLVVIGFLLLCSSQVNAYFFTKIGEEFTQPGETIYNAKRIYACTLVKTSTKGSPGGFFSSADSSVKSIEGYCHNMAGTVFPFSAAPEQLASLTQYAGREVLIHLSDQKKLENAQTDNILLDVKPADNSEAVAKLECGPPAGKHLYDTEDVWSRGFRFAKAYFAEHAEEGWKLLLLEGKNSQVIWGEDAVVQLGRYCNAHVHDLLMIDEPLIFVYVQREEGGPYYIEGVRRLLLTPLEDAENPQ